VKLAIVGGVDKARSSMANRSFMVAASQVRKTDDNDGTNPTT